MEPTNGNHKEDVMTVGELKATLAQYDDSLEVVVERTETYELDEVDEGDRPGWISRGPGQAEAITKACVILYPGACVDARPA